MIEIVMDDIEPAKLKTLNNEQRSLLRNMMKYALRNVSVTEIEQPNTKESNQKLWSLLWQLRPSNTLSTAIST